MRDDDELLPITANALSSDPGLLEAVRTIGAARGIDYLDDQRVRRLLEDGRRTVHRARSGRRSWVGGTVFVVGCAAGAFLLASGLNGPLRTWPAPALAAICAVLCGWGLAMLIIAYRRAQHLLAHPHLAGYRLVLAAATAYDVPVAHVPAWLIGAREAGGRPSMPLPSYPVPAEQVRRMRTGELSPAPDQTDTIPVPYKPAAVVEYEHLAGRGGWHLEGGASLVVAGTIAAAWAYWTGQPAGYAGLALVPLGLWAWAAGFRLDRRKEMLRRSAHDYLRQLMAAQIIGAIIPELSEPLRDLMTKTAHERAITRLSRRRLASVRATVHDTSYRQDHVTLRTPRPPDNQAE